MSLRRSRCRIILLADVDSFEVQAYQRDNPHLKGKPCVVTNSAGRIVSVSYEAKAFGVSRSDYCFQKARAKCPSLINIKIPERPDNPGRPDYTVVRQATNEIVEELRCICLEQEALAPIFEYSSRDEFYMDATELIGGIMRAQENKFPSEIFDLWHKSIVETPNGPVPAIDWRSNSVTEIRLFWGLGLGSMILEKIKIKTGFQVSVGVGSNKLIAKLACGLNKPAAVTLILPDALMQVGKRIKIEDVPGLGGKSGNAIKKSLKVTTMKDLSRFKVSEIASVRLPNSGAVLGYKKAQEIFESVNGINSDEVTEKWAPSSITTSATYRKGKKYDFTFLQGEICNLIKTILQRAEEELMWRQRIPLSIKLIIWRYNKETKSCRLEYPVDVQNADEVLDMFLEEMRLDDVWDSDEEGQPLEKIELLAQPFKQVDD